jgi:tRNA pseudouridine55 synthase
MSMRHGFLLVNKSSGPTSHDVVARVRRTLHERSIGHLGTLDPAADGLLVLAVGAKALKAVEFFVGADKEYEAHVKLGSTSTTFDREGALSPVTLKPGWKIPEDAARIRVVIEQRFIGNIKQVPPQHSAISIGGERAYDKARRGESVDMPVREVEISECDILSYDYPHLILRVRCSSGTYIRSLAHDLGEALGCGGYLDGLRRTMVGPWSLRRAVTVDQVKWTDVVPLKEVLVSLPRIDLKAEQWEELKHGRPIVGVIPDPSQPLVAWIDGLPVAFLENDSRREGMLKPRKVI